MSSLTVQMLKGLEHSGAMIVSLLLKGTLIESAVVWRSSWEWFGSEREDAQWSWAKICITCDKGMTPGWKAEKNFLDSMNSLLFCQARCGKVQWKTELRSKVTVNGCYRVLVALLMNSEQSLFVSRGRAPLWRGLGVKSPQRRYVQGYICPLCRNLPNGTFRVDPHK